MLRSRAKMIILISLLSWVDDMMYQKVPGAETGRYNIGK